jgi:Zn finger protein HypA/HybF involved in hydrogenase expression
METTWRTYEEVAAYLLEQNAREFGLEKIEGKQIIQGHTSGTSWEIDAKGIREGNEGFIIIECRRYTASKQNQEKLGSLAYRIKDTGAVGGIIVSPLGIQEGAEKIAASENIINVQLDANCTVTDFVMKFLNKVMVGLSGRLGLSGVLSKEVTRTCQTCGRRFVAVKNERICPDCQAKLSSE